ncbi:hypothetical protein [Micromonospora globbae]|uniref:hypothetical protein n=1 Tax=Micromonospora globbae TaxID=1894969 RepID=UPI0034295A28|nr:hypothetical protein OH732_13480 [Micromonospora globbae]
MDLWDLTRLLFRRWYVALPILLASVLTAALVGQSVKPDYRSTGNLVLIPAPGPVEPANPKQPTAERPKNPWGDLGLEALGNAAILKVLDQKTLKGLADSGLSDSITVQVTPRAPILYVEAVGNSPAQATATVREVIRLLVAEVAEQQKGFGVLPQDTITTLTLTDGADVEAVTSKVKRVLVVIVGLGLLITAAGTIAVDVLLRRRQRRRGRVDVDEADEALRAEAAAREPGQRRVDVPPHGHDGEAVRRARLGPEPGAYRSREQPGAGAERRVAVEPKPGRHPQQGVEYVPPRTPPTAAPAADRTVILPPARGQWSGREGRNGGR